MAFGLRVLLKELGCVEEKVMLGVVDELIDIGITEVIDAACLDDENIKKIFHCPLKVEAAQRFVQRAERYNDGWASLSTRIFTAPPSSSSSTSCVVAPPPPIVRKRVKSSVLALQASARSFTIRSVVGKKFVKRDTSVTTGSLAAKGKDDMKKALLKVHEVFLCFAKASPRFAG